MVAMSLEARTGRERQLYENGRRLVAGCVPYRVKAGSALVRRTGARGATVEESIEVLMISSPNRRDLVFPKGGWEKDETVFEAAKREALEEAGIRGTVHEKELGIWESRSKSSEISRNPFGTCKCHFFAMEVEEELDSWAEQAYHERRWVSVEEAAELCRYPWMKEALQKCVEFLETQSVPAREPAYGAKMTTAPKYVESVRSGEEFLETQSVPAREPAYGAKMTTAPKCVESVRSGGSNCTVLCTSSRMSGAEKSPRVALV